MLPEGGAQRCGEHVPLLRDAGLEQPQTQPTLGQPVPELQGKEPRNQLPEVSACPAGRDRAGARPGRSDELGSAERLRRRHCKAEVSPRPTAGTAGRGEAPPPAPQPPQNEPKGGECASGFRGRPSPLQLISFPEFGLFFPNYSLTGLSPPLQPSI